MTLGFSLQQIMDYINFMNTLPGDVPPEYSHYANLSALIHNYDLNNKAWSDILSRPVDLQLILDGYTDIIGNQTQAWEEMFKRVLQSQGGWYPQVAPSVK